MKLIAEQAQSCVRYSFFCPGCNESHTFSVPGWSLEGDAERSIPLWGINANPEQAGWTGSPKAFAHLYIDDMAFGCPLMDLSFRGARPVVDWWAVGPAVLARIIEANRASEPGARGQSRP